MSMRRIVGVIAFAALGHSLSLAAEKLPDAASVAKEIGKPVKFQDEVKAVSFSRSTSGYYLSFGAPYPQQVLSVWLPAAVYDRLPYRASMVGRTVQVAGNVESSGTGPLINLNSTDGLTILQADESILSRPSLDGKQDRSQFKTAVWQTFKRGDYNILEALGESLRHSRELLFDGSWLSEAFFDAFRLSPNSPREHYAEMNKRLADWEKTRPVSSVLPLIKAGYHIDLAWKWRGNGYADTVTPEGLAGFKNELANARRILENNSTAKSYREHFTLMQTVALGQQWSRDEYERLFIEAVNLQPDYYEFYCHKAQYLLPRWNGKKGEWEEFAEHERQKAGAGGAGDALYARIAWSMRNFYKNVYRESDVSWPKVASGWQALIRQYPNSNYLKSVYANLCWRIGDRERLRAALPLIGPSPDMSVWVNLENVSLAQKFADGLESVDSER
jgi:hypothetical protein